MEGIDLALLIQIFKGFNSAMPRLALAEPAWLRYKLEKGLRAVYPAPQVSRGGAALFSAGRTSLIHM